MTVRVAAVDANVLYSTELTDLLLSLATHRLVRVHWSVFGLVALFALQLVVGTSS